VGDVLVCLDYRDRIFVHIHQLFCCEIGSMSLTSPVIYLRTKLSEIDAVKVSLCSADLFINVKVCKTWIAFQVGNSV